MALFKSEAKPITVEVGGRVFLKFNNTQRLFDKYAFMQIQSGQYYFTNCFEYINKVNLNSKYEVLYVSDYALYFYIHDLKRNTLTAYNYDAYLYAKNKLGLELDIKFVSEGEVEQNNLVLSAYTNEYIDAIYLPKGLAYMEGKRYARIRGNMNNFLHHVEIDKLVFREYRQSDKGSVLDLYKSWKQMSKENGNTFIVDAKVFLSGLDNDYIKKFLLVCGGKLFGFISCLIVGKWCFIYSMKSTRDVPNQNTYMVSRMWKFICDNCPDVEYINLGGIDNINAKGTDYKMLLKPDMFVRYYSNVKVGGC